MSALAKLLEASKAYREAQDASFNWKRPWPDESEELRRYESRISRHERDLEEGERRSHDMLLDAARDPALDEAVREIEDACREIVLCAEGYPARDQMREAVQAIRAALGQT